MFKNKVPLLCDLYCFLWIRQSQNWSQLVENQSMSTIPWTPQMWLPHMIRNWKNLQQYVGSIACNLSDPYIRMLCYCWAVIDWDVYICYVWSWPFRVVRPLEMWLYITVKLYFPWLLTEPYNWVLEVYDFKPSLKTTDIVAGLQTFK